METKCISHKMLANFSPFNRLSGDELFLLAGRTVVDKARKGEQLIKVGEHASKSLYLLQGKVMVKARDGKETIIDTRDLVRRDPISHLVPHNYDVTCMSDVSYFLVDHNIIESVLSRVSASTYSAEEHFIDESCFSEEIFTEIYQDLIEDTLSLPKLANLAEEIQVRVESDASFDTILPLLIMEPSMSAYVMRLANSPIFASAGKVITIGSALEKISIRDELGVIVHRAAKAQYKSYEKNLHKNLYKVWRQSLEIGVIGSRLAQRSGSLHPDTVLNLGLFHNIGMYMVYLYAHQRLNTISDHELPKTVLRLHKEVGKIIMKKWNFPTEYILSVDAAEDWSRVNTSAIDYQDAITLGRVLSFLGKHPNQDTFPVNLEQLPRDIGQVPSLAKFGFTMDKPRELLEFLTECRRAVAAYQNNVMALTTTRSALHSAQNRQVAGAGRR